MPPDEAKRALVAEWLRKADADLGVAEYLVEDDVAFPGVIAFHCQQAAEKYIKALLTWTDVDFPKTHDLRGLLDMLPPSHAQLGDELSEIIVLTPYGVELRYPTDRPEATPDEAREAVQLAQGVRAAIMPLLHGSSDDGGGSREEMP